LTMHSLDKFINDPRFFWVFMLAVAWSVTVKGIALWQSARAGQRAWFIILMVVNTLGILELTYLLAFAKPLAKNLKER
jgi:hypothetical protein